jgi:hypothetical protein
MARTVVAIFDDFQTANSAVRDLVDSGFPRDSISIVANNSTGEFGAPTATGAPPAVAGDNVAGETGAGAGVGAGIGAAIGGIGGLLVGLGALVIPGIGPVIAAGPLAIAISTLTGAGVGAVAGGMTGGLLGALIGLGIPEEEAEFYAEGVRRGGILVTAQAEDYNAEQITEILNRHNPMDINHEIAHWRSEGWQGYDPNAQTVVTRPTGQTSIGRSVDTTQPVGQSDWDQENPVYRSHYQSFLANSGYPYDYYVPAYQFGYGIAGNARYKYSTWADVEPEAQRDWEREHPGTWDRFRAAIRAAWEDVVED